MIENGDQRERLVHHNKNYSKIWKSRNASEIKTDWCFFKHFLKIFVLDTSKNISGPPV